MPQYSLVSNKENGLAIVRGGGVAKKERPLNGRALRSRSVGAERGTGRLMNAAALVFSLWHSQPIAGEIPLLENGLG
jgi:hypothetical protein